MQPPAVHPPPRPRRRAAAPRLAPALAAAHPAPDRAALRKGLALSAFLLLALCLLAVFAPAAAGQHAAAAGQETAAPGPESADTARFDEEPPAAADLTGRYDGVLVDLGNVLPRELASRITIRLDRLTPAAELQRLSALLAEKGQDALRDELADREVGRVQVDMEVGYPIGAAFATDGEDGMRHLVLLIARPMSIGEVLRGSRLVDYPFSVIELDLEPQGYGSGELAVAASIALLSENRVRLDEYPVHPLRIVRVEHEERR